MPSKPVGGFELVLGQLYNDFWFNEQSPNHNGPPCTKCAATTTVHKLEKVMLAFGKLIVRNCTVHTCPNCLHELLHDYHERPKKATKQNLVTIFSKLPKSVQATILMKGGLK